ncbi:MAG: hypothetical protein ACRDL4_13255 [Thermoleophilaceae bacterium]
MSYQIRCVRIAEIISLLALRVRGDDPELAGEIADWLVKFAAAQPGFARPIGDRYAVCAVPVSVLLVGRHPQAVEDLLRKTTVWVCDRYERDQLGLAGADASPSEEIGRVLGTPFEHVTVERRQESQLAGVLLDLAALLDLRDLYADVRNDTLGVELYPSVLWVAVGRDQLSRVGQDNRWELNPDYADSIDGSAAAAPHLDGPGPRLIVPEGRWWDLLAISAAVRDRHFAAAIRAAAEEGST